MSKLITLTITESERDELDALLDTYIEEIRRDKGEHERIMARVDQNLAETKRNLEMIHANREMSLRLELPLVHLKEQQAAERENFWLQLENLILRMQRGLPPGEKSERDEGAEDQ